MEGVSGDAATSRGAADDVVRTVRELMDRNQALGQAIMEFVSEMRDRIKSSNLFGRAKLLPSKTKRQTPAWIDVLRWTN
jgi:hypothetical protein